MPHPIIFDCIAWTAECRRKYVEIDDRFAAWETKFADLLSTGRDAVARSRQLLAELDDRDQK